MREKGRRKWWNQRERKLARILLIIEQRRRTPTRDPKPEPTQKTQFAPRPNPSTATQTRNRRPVPRTWTPTRLRPSPFSAAQTLGPNRIPQPNKRTQPRNRNWDPNRPTTRASPDLNLHTRQLLVVPCVGVWRKLPLDSGGLINSTAVRDISSAHMAYSTRETYFSTYSTPFWPSSTWFWLVWGKTSYF